MLRGFKGSGRVTNLMPLADVQNPHATFPIPVQSVEVSILPRSVIKQPDSGIEARKETRREEAVSPHQLLGKGPSPINVGILTLWLRDYPDREAAVRLLRGFSEGFRIPAPPPSHPFWSANLRSVVGMEDVVRAKIAKEVQAGRVLGPFLQPPLPNLRVSTLGVPWSISPYPPFIISKRRIRK